MLPSCYQVVGLSSWNGAILVRGGSVWSALLHGPLTIAIARLGLVRGKAMHVSCHHEHSIMRPLCWHWGDQ